LIEQAGEEAQAYRRLRHDHLLNLVLHADTPESARPNGGTHCRIGQLLNERTRGREHPLPQIALGFS
jgi:hypothetical protein